MAIQLKTAGTWARLVVDGTVTIPGSPAAGDRMFLFASWKDFAITVTDPNGWTPIGTEFADGAVSATNGAGSVKVMAWYRDWESGDTAPNIDWSSNPTEGHVVIMLWEKAANEGWDTPQTVTAAITANTNWTATASSDVDITDGSVVMELVGFRDDSTTMTRSATTALEDDGSPNVTWNGNYVESPATHFNSTTGLDMSGDLGHRFVTTGASGVTLTGTGTLAASETGAAKWVIQSVSLIPGRGFAQAQAYIFIRYAAAVNTSEPNAWWRLGEPSGFPQDLVGTAEVDAIAGSPTYGVTHALGDGDTAMAFTGSASYLRIPNNTGLNMGNGPLTVEVWVRRTTVGNITAHQIFGRGANGYAVGFQANTDKFYLAKQGVATIATESTTTTDTDWHHFAATWDGVTAKIYKDGTDVTTFVGAQTLTDPTATSYIAGNGGTLGYEGELDELAIYNRVLDQAEIQRHLDTVIFRGYGQAQAQIMAFNIEGFAQAQSQIKQIYHGFAQAQAQIKTADVEGFAQAMARIGPTTYERILKGISGLQSFWTLGEPSGSSNIGDYQGSISGTVNGTPTFSQASINPQQIEPGIRFSASSQSLTFGDNYDFPNATDTYTILVWFKHTGSVSGTETFISKNSAGSIGSDIDVTSTSVRQSRDSTNGANITAAEILGDTWYFYAAVSNGGASWVGFINNARGSGSSAVAATNTAVDFTLGKPAWTTIGAFAGTLASVAVFNAAISFDDFQALYTVANSGAIARPAQAQARIKLIHSGLAQAQATIDTGIYSALDTFTRTRSGIGWGTADSGGDWVHYAEPEISDVNGSEGTYSPAISDNGDHKWLPSVTATNNQYTKVRVKFSSVSITDNSISARVYSLSPKVNAVNVGVSAQVYVSGSEFRLAVHIGAQLSSDVLIGTAVANTYVWLLVQHIRPFNGNFAARAKAWFDGDPEPSGWQVTLSSAYNSGQGGAPFTVREKVGSVGLDEFATGAESVAGVVVTYDNFESGPAGWSQYGQAQAYIIRTDNGFGQAQAKIDTPATSFTEYAQAQASILQTYNVFAQSQADIKQTYNSFAQAQADILQVYNVFAQAQAQIKQTYSAFAQAQTRIEQTYNEFAQAQAQIKQTYTVYAQAQADIKQTYNEFAQAQADILQVYQGYAQAQTWIEQTYNSFAQAQAQILQVYNAHGQAQADTKQTYNSFAQAQADILQIYQNYAQALALIIKTYHGVAQSQATILSVEEGFGQAQAQILQTYNQFAQAQAQLISFEVEAFAQALANIKGVDLEGVAQAQAKINAFDVEGFAQAQTQIKQTYNGFAQAQANINTTYNAFAQAQADILVTYNGFAQAQTWIEQTYNSYGQSQAQIKQTYNQFSQAQALIGGIGAGYGQAQADIKATYASFAQAQASILVTYNSYAQAQANIEQTYQGYGQAQTNIKATLNGYAQTQGTVKATYTAAAQAQADIKAISTTYAQAQAGIKQIYQEYAQAQALIAQRFNGYAQAQGQIKQVYNVHVQAQASILQTYNEYGQAQSQIKQIYLGFGQTQAYILRVNSEHGQAQAIIVNAGLVYGNAQATILVTTVCYANAQAYISINVNVYALAQALIASQYGFSQAQASIRVLHTLKRATASDKASLRSTAQDKLHISMSAQDKSISAQSNDIA